MWWLILASSLTLEAGASAGWDLNVYRTPSAPYEDPETSATRTSSPTRAGVLLPSAALELQLGDRIRFELENEFDARFYLGTGNVSNASGFRNMGAAWLGYDPSDVVTVDVGVDTTVRSYNYLHRGDGTVRVTESTATDEGDRFRYVQGVAFVRTKVRLKTGTRVTLDGRAGRREYRDVPTLESYDQNVVGGALSVRQKVGGDWRVKATYDLDTRLYVTHRAADAGGSLVDGTTRTLLNHGAVVRATWDPKGTKVSTWYSFQRRQDVFEDYRSHTQHRVGASAEFDVGRRVTVDTTLSGYLRDYDRRTAPSGEIRARQSVRLSSEVRFDVWKFVQLRAGGGARLYNDTNPYYSYTDAMVFVGTFAAF